jgi:hypothetical protein
MPVFTETDLVLEGIGALLTPPAEPTPAIAAATAPALPARPLSEPESLALLRGFGVASVETVECDSLAQAQEAAARLGWPVVLKGVVAGVAHKSDAGLVRVNLRDAGALQSAYTALNAPRVIVQPMLSGELEAIAGISRSPGVGLVLICGLGGIHAEALRDVCTWPVPVSRAAIADRLAQSSLGRVLAGARWRHQHAAAALIDLLCALQAAAVTLGDRLEAIDLNPVLLGEAGAVAVDALVVPHG